MAKISKIILATHNEGKILEYKVLAENYPFEFTTLADLAIEAEPEEDGKTFEENAVKKAEFYSQFSDLPVLAEDGGIEIDYLRGEPGVFSRRWLGYKATDEELISMTLEKLKGVPEEKRGAQFRVALALRLDDKNTLISEGVLRGLITEKPSEKIIPGFPFRSLFYVPDLGRVLGELAMEEEAKIAHRRIALKNLFEKMKAA